jgi:hypothetical protein
MTGIWRGIDPGIFIPTRRPVRKALPSVRVKRPLMRPARYSKSMQLSIETSRTTRLERPNWYTSHSEAGARAAETRHIIEAVLSR